MFQILAYYLSRVNYVCMHTSEPSCRDEVFTFFTLFDGADNKRAIYQFIDIAICVT